MAKDQGGEERIRAIKEALDILDRELGREIVESLRSAIVEAMQEYEGDTNAQAAAALAAVLDFRPVTTQGALSETLDEIAGLVEGLTGLEDVQYVVETLEGPRAYSIRSHLPTESPAGLTDNEEAELESYIVQYLAPDEPSDQRAPRGPQP